MAKRRGMTDRQIDDWRAWSDAQRSKHRYMTQGEYMAWCRAGDAISSPIENCSFPGGLTIDFNTPPIIGRTEK